MPVNRAGRDGAYSKSDLAFGGELPEIFVPPAVSFEYLRRFQYLGYISRLFRCLPLVVVVERPKQRFLQFPAASLAFSAIRSAT